MTQDGLRRRNFNVTNIDVAGSTTLIGDVSATADIYAMSGSITMGAGIVMDDIEVGKTIITASNNEEGTVLWNVPAETIISGGMWVVGSAASGTTMAMVAKPCPGPTIVPLGIQLGDVASGAFATIQVKGQNNSIIADATIVAGAAVSVGSGAALNTGLTTAVAGRGRALALRGAGSEGVLSVYLL